MVTRVQHVPQHLAAQVEANQQGTIGTPQAPSTPAPRVHGGAVSFTAGGEEVQHLASAKHVADFSGTPGGSVVATLRRDGAAQSVELVPGLPSSRTDVRIALKEGLLAFDSTGRLVDAANMQDKVDAMTAPPQAPEEAPQDPGADAFTPEADQAFAEMIAPLEQGHYDAAVASAIGVVSMGGDSLEGTANRLAQQAGMDPAQALEMISKAEQHYAAAVARALAPMGLQGDRLEQFYSSLRDTPEKLQNALQSLVHLRDPSGFKAAAVEFIRRNPPDLSWLTEAGWEVHTEYDTGETLVKRPGGEWQRMTDVTKQAHQRPQQQAQAPQQAPARQQWTEPAADGNASPGWFEVERREKQKWKDRATRSAPTTRPGRRWRSGMAAEMTGSGASLPTTTTRSTRSTWDAHRGRWRARCCVNGRRPVPGVLPRP